VKKLSLPRIQYLVVEMSRKNTIVFHLVLVFLFLKVTKLGIYSIIYISAAVTDIDTSGIHSFEELYKTLQHRIVHVSSKKKKKKTISLMVE
jgi:hypothetical protein